ncbi:MAG TPA: imidazoleglycerol-phosphate dehydratase HisB [Coriobacteriia bacterium]|jgi:imidazoleglycerol-phosphate dehydratase
MSRVGTVTRKTAETNVVLTLDLDGEGRCDIATGVPFFDHMLDAIGRHGLLDLAVTAEGDLHVDAHHTVEDVGICLGQALVEALGDKRGIRRYGSVTVPMDEAAVSCALDISGRPYLLYDVAVPIELIGTFDTTLAEEFFRALANNAGLTLHLRSLSGGNAHHVVEAAAKAFAVALRDAVAVDPRAGLPSTKGTL